MPQIQHRLKYKRRFDHTRIFQQASRKIFYLLFWKIIGSFMSGNLSAPQLERITKSLKKTPLYVQALRKNLGLTTLDTLEMIKESEKQNIFQNYKINSKAIQKSLQLSWSYFENSMLKTIQSNQKMDKAQYEFLKESLDSEQNSMPCCLTARVLCDKPLQIQVYSIKDDVFTIEQRRHIYTKSGFTYKCQNKSDKKIETKMDYIVQIIEPFEQQKMEIGNQDQQGLTIRIIGQIAKRIIKISRQLNIKAIIIGDNSQLVSKNFLNPETRYNRHYVQSAKDKIYSGFKGILFKSIPQVVGFPPYFCPIGWVRFSLFVAANAQEFDKKYKNWLIAYHGTSKDAVLSILSHGFRCATGCFSKNEPMSYYTPSIKYAAMYAQPVYSAKLNKFIQVVLSVRINPQVIHKRKGHTLPNSFRDGDINFNTLWPNQFQWLVKGKSTVRMDQIQIKKKYKKGYEDNIRTQDGVLIYGIMIKISDTQPAYRKIREK